MVLAASLVALLGVPQDLPPAVVPARLRVCNQQGEPLAKATATLATTEQFDNDSLGARPDALAGPDGQIQLALPARHPRATLVLAAPGCTTLEVPVATMPRAAPLDLGTFILFPGVLRTGSVHDGHGHPLAGVLVRATDPWQGFGAGEVTYASSTRTDARGFYRLRGALPGSVSIEFTKWGYHGRRITNVLGDTPLDLDLQDATPTTGRLVGMPPDAQLRVQAEVADGATSPLELTADGTFALIPPAQGAYQLVVTRGTEELARSPRLQGAASDITLSPAGTPRTVTLRVTIARRPVADFWLLASWSTDRDLEHWPAAGLVQRHGQRVIGPTTSLTIPAWAKQTFLVVQTAGAVAQTIRWNHAKAGEYECDLAPAGAVTGRLVDAATGQPVADASCQLCTEDVPAAMPEDTPRTEANGRFHIDFAEPGPRQLLIQKDDYDNPAVVDVEVAAATVQDVGDIPIVRNQARLFGKLTKADLPRVTWVGTKTETAIGRVDPVERTFSLPVGPTTVDLELLMPSATAASPMLRLPLGRASGKDQEQRFDAPAPLAILGGKVRVTGPRDPLALRVFAWPADTHAARTPATATAAADVDSGGNFELRVPAAGWWLQVMDLRTGQSIAALESPIDVQPRQTRRVDLESTLHQVTLRLQPQSQGTPLVVAEIRLARAHQRLFEPNPHLPYRIALPAGATALELWIPPTEFEATAIRRHLPQNQNDGREEVEVGAVAFAATEPTCEAVLSVTPPIAR